MRHPRRRRSVFPAVRIRGCRRGRGGVWSPHLCLDPRLLRRLELLWSGANHPSEVKLALPCRRSSGVIGICIALAPCEVCRVSEVLPLSFNILKSVLNTAELYSRRRQVTAIVGVLRNWNFRTKFSREVDCETYSLNCSDRSNAGCWGWQPKRGQQEAEV